MTDRDTHFQGFAKLLWREMLDIHGYIDERDHSYGANEAPEYEQLIAQRAYDLVEHILKQTPVGDRYIRYFKDMTEWPDKSAFGDALADLAKIYEKQKFTQSPDLPTAE